MDSFYVPFEGARNLLLRLTSFDSLTTNFIFAKTVFSGAILPGVI
jgi:hypothetical protein